MKAERVYRVESRTPGRFYTVDLANGKCDCPHFLYRLRKTGGECKHIAAAKSIAAGGADYDSLIGFVRENAFVDSVELIERYGEAAVDALIRNGELVEEQGKIRLT